MNEQFATYEIAHRLKELGFDEGCLAAFYIQENREPTFSYSAYLDDEPPTYLKNDFKDTAAAPLYQQVIDWLREKHEIKLIEDPQIGWNIWWRDADRRYFNSDKWSDSLPAAIIKALELISKPGTTSTPHRLEVIEAMKSYARQSCEAVRKECADKVKLESRSCGDPDTCGCLGHCQHPCYYINRKSILSVDIEPFIK